jgi:hypothetical protein
MLAKYYQGLRKPSPKLSRQLRPITDEIFSQMPTQDTSYVLDSFVIADDQISIYGKHTLM